MYKQKPTTYRATTQLMFKSDTPISLDSATGIVRGGIPSGNLMQSLITSNAIVGRVGSNQEFASIPSLENMDAKQIVAMVRSGIRFQTITDQKDSRDRMIAALNFDGPDPQVCVAAVNAVSEAISQHSQRAVIATQWAGSPSIDFYQRYFAPQHGVNEDSATGSAHAVLARYWQQKRGQHQFIARQCSSAGGILHSKL